MAEFYKNNSNIRAANSIEYIDPETYKFRAQEILKCKKDIIYFTEHYFTILSLDKGKSIIKLYPKQKELLKCIQDNKRIVCVSSRQVGKCLLSSTYIKIRNKKTGLEEEITIGEFEKRITNK